MHLAKIANAYVVELLGKTGEPKADRPVQFQVKHRDFRDPVRVTLKSDPSGRIQLGPLNDITSVTATGPEGSPRIWHLQPDQHTYYGSVHAAAGAPVTVPFVGSKLARTEVSLLERRGNTFIADRFDNLSVENGMLVAKGLPAGDYDLWLKVPNRHITLRIAAGESRANYVLGKIRHLEQRGESPLQIVAVASEKESLRIQLHNSNKFARVHVFATRYVPEYNAFGNIGRILDAEPTQYYRPPIEAYYASGRNIGDELRYILDRKSTQKYPGMMVERPSVLLNPWAVRTTQTAQQEAQAGTDFAATPPPAPADVAPRPESAAVADPKGIQPPLQSNLDFLSEASVVVTNLVPDDNGIVEIPRKGLGSHQHIHVVAVDPVSTAYRAVSLPEQPTKFRDLRLLAGLDPQKHFTQQKRTTVVTSGGTFELPDIVTSKFEAYDSLARVYGLYMTLSHDPKLLEFGFILNWPNLKPEEKRTQYSKYACHELNFFLFKKDPQFFTAVVKPYLANKRDKTFSIAGCSGMPLEADIDPWAHEQLNIVERILLAQRVPADTEHGKRHVRDLFDLLPPDIERSNLLFRTAIRGSALETSDALGVEAKAGDCVRI